MAKDDHLTLEPPPGTGIEDPGAHDLDSDDSDDHFSDARSGFDHSALTSPATIVPTTRVEKVDNEPRYGETPGTLAYSQREEDAQPDEIAVISEGNEAEQPVRTGTPGGQPIPTTVVEKIDPSSLSHGEVPGTSAYGKRTVDAVPDMVVRVGGYKSPGLRSRSSSTPGDLPIPITRVERVDSAPRHGEVPGTLSYEKRAADAKPDEMEEVPDALGSPTGVRSKNVTHARRKSSGAGKGRGHEAAHDYDEDGDGDDGGDFGDDFDDFEEGEEDAGFDDFNDGFQEAASSALPPASPFPITPAFPVLDFASLTGSPDAIFTSTTPHLNALFPPESIETSHLPPLAPDRNPVFLTPRSASLWSQLVAPPPLQPPNWIRSRIRRLFLVSLGVPVDLDEILPASKQKKLILPSIHLNPSSRGGGGSGSPRTSTDLRSISRVKHGDGNTSSTSVDSQGRPSRSDSRRRKGPAPPPELDLVAARQLCSVTEAALGGLTEEELKEHTARLQALVGTANEALEYWTKKTDEKLGDREAFEGVIENLVKHARKVRK